MDKHNGNQNPFSQENSEWNPKETVEAIQNVSKKVRVYSHRVKETMRALRESNVIPEMAEAIRDTSFAVRDTAYDINETTKELKKRGIISDTANAIETTWKSSEASFAIAREISNDAAKVSPHASKAIREGIDIIKKETNPAKIKDFKTSASVP